MIKRTDKQFENEGWQMTNYNVRDVAKRYQTHGAGLGPSAKRFVDKLASNDPVQLTLDLDNERVLTTDEAREKLKACNNILKGAAA